MHAKERKLLKIMYESGRGLKEGPGSDDESLMHFVYEWAHMISSVVYFD